MSASRLFASVTAVLAPFLACAGPAAANLGLPIGKNGLPTTFAGEAITVGLAFALPALLAGLFIVAKRITARMGRRGVVLLGAVTAGAVVLWVWPEARPVIAAIMGRSDGG